MKRVAVLSMVLLMVSLSSDAFARGGRGGGRSSRGGRSGGHSTHSPKPSSHHATQPGGIVPSKHGPHYSPVPKSNKDGTMSQCKGSGCGSWHGGPR